MSRWYCEAHLHLDPVPGRLITLFEGKECHVRDCTTTLSLMRIKTEDE